MFNNLKKEIEKDFDKEKNYNSILSKIESRNKNSRNRNKSIKFKYALIPICLILVLVISINSLDLFNNEEKSTLEKWKIKEVYLDDVIEDNMAVVPRWEDMSICQQFPTVEYNSYNYDCKYGEVPKNMIGKRMGESVLTGYDIYSKKTYTKNATIYYINNISQKCAIALKFPEADKYYSYINAYYVPETLQDFINDLNLKENISFGSIWYEEIHIDENNDTYLNTIEFPYVDDNIIWTMLFSNTSLKNIYSDDNNEINTSRKIMSISTNIPILGYKNISCSITEDGYLVTNILDTGKAFYIGKDKVNEFVNYVINNCEGYKIVYVNKDGANYNNNIIGGDNTVGDDTIVTMENNITDNVISKKLE